MPEKNKGILGLASLAVFLVLGLITIIAAVVTVEAGSVKEVLRFGKPIGRTLEPGMSFIVPFADSVVKLNTKRLVYETTSQEKQKGSQADYKDFPVDTNTSDGQQVDIYYTVRFSIDPTKTTWIVNNIGNESALVEKVIKTDSRIWARNVPREYSATELYTGNIQQIQAKIEDVLRPKFADNGVLLDSVGIREIKFTQQYVNAIEAKQIAAVEVETAKNRAEQAIHEKARKITEAEGQAKEQQLQRETISDQLLRKMWIERWNGNLPTYMMGDSQALIQLPN